MIDIETKVYDELRSVLVASYPNLSIKSIPDYTPAKFPTVEFSQIDSYVNNASVSSGGVKHLNVAFMLTIYTKGTSRKKDAKAILAIATDKLHSLNLMLRSNVGYAYENDTYRIDARYEATASSTTIYRR